MAARPPNENVKISCTVCVYIGKVERTVEVLFDPFRGHASAMHVLDGVSMQYAGWRHGRPEDREAAAEICMTEESVASVRFVITVGIRVGLLNVSKGG
jgi:hypothetical protein